MASTAKCISLVLDAGPLLSLSPLRGLAQTYFTTPQVLAELKDKRAREHFERLGLNAGVKVEVRSPDAASLATVIQFAKKTGDYAVLSHADLCVLALTYALDLQAKKAGEVARVESETTNNNNLENTASQVSEKNDTVEDVQDPPPSEDEHDETPQEETEEEERDLEPLDVELHPTSPPSEPKDHSPEEETPPLFDDPSDSDDGEGEWITPSNVSLHKSRALDLLPTVDGGPKENKDTTPIAAGCMTADFAMQNVLLQMGLSLVGVEGKRIERVKSWVLRCHACFTICKDPTKKFCPSCGNPTLIRASVTIVSPHSTTTTTPAPNLKIHLKPNFQYRTRGTIYPIPLPKPGSSKHGPGEGLILREDQTAYVRARKMVEGRREREEERMKKGIIARGKDGDGVSGVGSWMDPDWVPEMMRVGAGGKGRDGGGGDMPVVGYGRKNPNERRRKR